MDHGLGACAAPAGGPGVNCRGRVLHFSAMGARAAPSNARRTGTPLMTPTVPPSAAAGQAVRRLGRYQLLRLLAKTARSMVWLVSDGRSGQELMLVIPRQKPEPEQALQRWLESALRAGRLQHPGLAVPEAVDVEEGWPFMAYARAQGVLLTERMGRQGVLAAELVGGMGPAIEALASAHEASHSHGDLHAGMVLVPDAGGYRLIGLGVVQPPPEAGQGGLAQRQRAERDVLALGLLLHHGLVGQPPLGEADLMTVAERLPPAGREVVRLPRADTQPIADPLRAIVNRATDRQERQRYRNARTLARALGGWLKATSDTDSGPLALLLDRLRVVGLLPAMAGGLQRARRLQMMDRERVDGLAEVVLEDIAMSLELLRATNLATRRVGARASNGTILTVRRAITMLGLDGVQRAAQALKPWPGPLGEAAAAELAHQMDLARRAGQVARWLRLPGYDGELVYLLAVMQRLGRLVVHYHFPEEAVQIRRLMQPAPAARRGEPDEPGMGEQAAGFAVLGVDTEALASAVARFWGFDEQALAMMRRLPADAPVHLPDTDAERLRQTASCANEVIDVQTGPAALRAAGFQHVAQRYGRLLGVGAPVLQQYALGQGPETEGEDDEAPSTDRSAVPRQGGRQEDG